MILILTGAGDPTVDRVTRYLGERGAPFFRFDPGQFPANARISMWFSQTGLQSQTLRIGDTQLDFGEVHVAWYRRPGVSTAPPEIADERVRMGVEEESATFLRDLWESLECAWVPAPFFTLRRAEMKALQLKRAGALGFELPSTLITNEPDHFRDLYRDTRGHLITKRVLSRPLPGWTNEVRYAEPVTTRDVGYINAVRFSPIIGQAYVPKASELRITVVANRVFASEIDSQATYRTRHDWKRYDLESSSHQPHELPTEVASRCTRLVESFGLRYGTIDMVMTPDGRYVFLELNPNGQYLWVEDLTGLPISEAICDLLVSLDTPPQETS